MSLTQIHTPEIYPNVIFDLHVHANAQIQGIKILPGTVIERGTVQFAADGVSGNLLAVQASDTRLHSQGTDIGTTANTFIINTDHVAGDNSTIVLRSSDPAYGGALRYNDSSYRVEFSENYNGVRTWKQLASTTDLSNGIMYRTSKLGSQSDDTGRTIYSLNNGNFTDIQKLIVFINGGFKSYLAGDYSAVDSRSIQFAYPIEDEDYVELIVYADVYFRSSVVGASAFDELRTQYIISGPSLTEDYQSVMIYVNGQLKTDSPPGGQLPDYIILNDHMIQFTYPRDVEDTIEAIVATVGTVKSVIQATDITGTTAPIFRVANNSNDMGNYALLFGSGNGYDVGIYSKNGVVGFQDYGGIFTPFRDAGTISVTGLPVGIDEQILISSSLGTYGCSWAYPYQCKLLPDGPQGYMLVSDPDTVSGTRWIMPPLTGSTLPPGPNGYILIADPNVPLGVKWVDPVEYFNVTPGDKPVTTTYQRVLIYDGASTSHSSWSPYIDVNTQYINTDSIVANSTALLTLPSGSNGYVLISNSMASNGLGMEWINVIDGDSSAAEHSIGVSLATASLTPGPNGYILFSDTSDSTMGVWTNVIDGGVIS